MAEILRSVIAVIGIDIGKNSFHVVGLDGRGAVALRQKWSRGQVEARLANIAALPWENGRTTSGAMIYRRVVDFHGYYPHPTPRALSDCLRKIRRCHGLTSRQAARLTDIDQQAFLMWELGKWTPTVLTRARLDNFLERFEPGLPRDCQPLTAKGVQADIPYRSSGLLSLTHCEPHPASRTRLGLSQV
jgi:hypothetical protein